MRNLKLKGLKYENGKYYLYDNRYIFFPPQIIEVLSSIYGEGVKSLLVWLGKKAGWSLIQDWDDNLKSKTLNDLVNNFCNILSNQGWGAFIPKQISDEKVIIELDYNVSNELSTKSRYVCYYITGILSGFGEYALYRVNVIEEICCVENPNEKECKFIIQKKK